MQKIDSSGTRNYITDGDSPAAVLSDGLATFTPGLSERRSSTSSFYHGDALGSTRSQTNASQSVTDSKRYDAFGMLIASSGSNPTPFGFVGGSQYQTDADSGLMLLGHRYYDASIGRFISRDPAYAGTNWYAYCENNPLGGTDPSGLDKSYYEQSRDFLLGEIRGFIGPPPVEDDFIDLIGKKFGLPAFPRNDHPKDENDPDIQDGESFGTVLAIVEMMISPAAAAETSGGRLSARLRRQTQIPERSLNPFKGKTPAEIDQMYRQKGYSISGPDPVNGRGGYINPRTGRSIHLDIQNRHNEPPHVDVNRIRSYRGKLEK